MAYVTWCRPLQMGGFIWQPIFDWPLTVSSPFDRAVSRFPWCWRERSVLQRYSHESDHRDHEYNQHRRHGRVSAREWKLPDFGRTVGSRSNLHYRSPIYPAGRWRQVRKTLNVTVAGMSVPLSVPLTGTGKSLTFTPTKLNWGAILIGQTSVPKLLTVNIFGKDPTTFNSVNIGNDSAEYAISSNTCTGSQKGPSHCSIYVTFTPNFGGPRSGTLNLSDTSGNQVINLTGTGEGIDLSAKFLGFGKVQVGNTSAPQTLSAQVLGKARQPSVTLRSMAPTPAIMAYSQTLAAGRPSLLGAAAKSSWFSNHCIPELGRPTSTSRTMMASPPWLLNFQAKGSSSIERDCRMRGSHVTKQRTISMAIAVLGLFACPGTAARAGRRSALADRFELC